MKKIGILTFHRTKNYGALLQAYALKKIICEIGANVKIINYLSPAIEKSNNIFSFKKSFKKNIKNIIKLFFLPRIIISNKKFNNFRKNYLIDTPPITAKEINGIENIYDIFITGSDQVFNPRLTNFDSNYLLSFVNNNDKKYSYSASLGFITLTTKEELFLKNNLINFSKISVREKQAANIINKIINKKVFTHLDPTLLLNEKKWKEFVKDKISQDEYVLLYLIDKNPKIIQYAKKLSERKEIKLVYISAASVNLTGVKSICVTPDKWIEYFIKAKYIVTNSFHGLCFSINFNKQFFIDFLSNTWFVNSRLENLLDLTNLRDRLIDSIKTDYDKPIDWNSVNKIIEIEREKSLNYLKSIVL